jgi:transposase
MEQWNEIRHRVLVDGQSKRSICKEFGLHWETLQKILKHSEPPGYQMQSPRKKRKLESFLPIIEQILKDDRLMPRKQRHTAQRIFERLKKENEYDGGITIVKDAVRAWRRHRAEVFVPLSHPPGEAQVDFGEGDILLNGRQTTVAFLVMSLPWSDAFFCCAFPRECTEAFLEGQTMTKAQLLSEEQATFLPLPAETFEARRVCTAAANSLSLVRFNRNDYSVPTAYAHHELTVVGTIEQVRILFGDSVIATHRRHWGREQVQFDPVHYLALLERKPGALDFARPMENWQLPDCFGILRRRLENELAGLGTRQFIKVLRLLEGASLSQVSDAVEQALGINTLSVDAVRLILQQRQEKPVGLFCLDGRPHLKSVQVQTPDLQAYRCLLTGGAA